MPSISPATYGLLLIANTQTRWTTSIPNTLIPTYIAQNIRQSMLQQRPTIIRSNTEDPKISRDTCSVTSLDFSGLRPTDIYRSFRVSSLYTSLKLITASQYRIQPERATTFSELSPPLQAIL
jgi:hypothetical protein